MLVRVPSFFDYLRVNAEDRDRGMEAAAHAGEKAAGMTTVNDYAALAAIALCFRPRRIFEIGTYLGVTSNFFLELLPECSVVSIAYRRPRWKLFGKAFNNSELSKGRVGSEVAGLRRSRFTQIYGDSHKLKSQKMLAGYGYFDLVFIDGDHSRQGVLQDTELAKLIIPESGVICWHDVNPKSSYMDVRRFLEDELPMTAIATLDAYIGGIAGWSRAIEQRLAGEVESSRPNAAAHRN